MNKEKKKNPNLKVGAILAIGALSAFLELNNKYVSTANSKIEPSTLNGFCIKESYGSLLEDKVECLIKEKRAKNQLSPDEKTAWSVYDFSTGDKVVSINENIPMQCASMMKPFVALAFYHLEKEGKLEYTSEIKKEMEKMIQKSINSSTNLIIKEIGSPRKVQKILSTNYPEIFQNTKIKEYIPKGGKTYKNKASASDYTRFLYALWNNELPQSDEIKRLMNLPNRDRIYAGVKNIPKETIVYDKTGTTAHLIGDMGILYIKSKDGKRKPYIFVGIIEKEKRPTELNKWYSSRGNIIREVSGVVYDSFK